MSLAALIRSMAEAGAPSEAIALAVEAIEACSAETERVRSLARDRKRRQRERDGHAPVTGQSRDRDGTGHAASPLDKKGLQTSKEINPPAPTNDAEASSVPPAGVEPGGDADQGSAGAKAKRPRQPPKRKPGSRLKVEWQPPAIDDLPLEVQALLRKWPAGAYELTALQFRNHWLSEGRAIGAKRDWGRTWCNWLMHENIQILRGAKAGIDYSIALKAEASPATAEKARVANAEIVQLQAGECAEAAAVRLALRLKCGEQVYETWLRPTLLSLDAGTMTIATASRFHLDYVERTLGETVEAVAIEAIGARGLRWEMLKPPDKRAA